jgi:hypothetical protein
MLPKTARAAQSRYRLPFQLASTNVASQLGYSMKMRRLVVWGMLLGTLLLSGVSASAEEKGGGVITGIGSTTIGGSIDSTTSGQIQILRDEIQSWWQIIVLWCRLHSPSHRS